MYGNQTGTVEGLMYIKKPRARRSQAKGKCQERLQQAFQLRDEERDSQIGNQERSGAARFARRRLLEYGKQRQQNKNRARINDLPLEMLPVCLMGAHARERVSCPFSLTRRAKFVSSRVPGCNGRKVSL